MLAHNHVMLSRESRKGGGMAQISMLKLVHSSSVHIKQRDDGIGNSFLLAIIYHPPGHYSNFVDDFSEFEDNLANYSDNVVLMGDFKIHVNNRSDTLAKCCVHHRHIWIQIACPVADPVEIIALHVSPYTSALSDHCLLTFQKCQIFRSTTCCLDTKLPELRNAYFSSVINLNKNNPKLLLAL